MTLVFTLVFAETNSVDNDVLEVVNRLNGVISSSDHSMADVTYHDVTLTHCKINVNGQPDDLKGSHFLYLRQAISLHKANPYRKRIVRVGPNYSTGQVVTTNYRPLRQVAFDGICDLPEEERFVDFSKDVGEPICTTYLTRQNNLFVGGTPPEGCPNTRNGAVRATSEVRLGEDWMSSWDRGWNAAGSQVWGATEGPYVFKRFKYGAPDSFAIAFGNRLVGKFSNVQQHTSNSASFELAEMTMCHVKLNDGEYKGNNLFVYMEKKTESNLQQKLYQITGDETTGRAKLIPNDFVNGRQLEGLCRKTEDVRFQLRPQMVEWNNSCQIDFHHDDDAGFFIGKTPEGGCRSTLNGSTYMTVDAKIRFGQLRIWERWYDATGNQVAGPTDAPYLYMRVK
jgi:hypothetical protein